MDTGAVKSHREEQEIYKQTEDRMKFFYRWLIATLAGAATVFVWGGISHMVLLKGFGFTRMSSEEPIVSALRASLPGDGLYFFPSIELRGNPTRESRPPGKRGFAPVLPE